MKLAAISKWAYRRAARAADSAPLPAGGDAGNGPVRRERPPRRADQRQPRLPLIVDIKGNSLDDGRGIRTVIFFKGCPLSCVWCHNPETLSPLPELAFAAAECVGCATCVGACPETALSLARPERVDRARCTLCGDCAEVCPARALTMVGREMTPEEVVARVLVDRPFFAASGGGVTLSGGEPTLHMEFTSAVLRGLQAAGVHTLVETCGLFSMERFAAELLPWIDTIYFDLKLMDPNRHRALCGVSNEVILANFAALAARARDGAFEILPRTPLIGGITATPANLEAIASFLERLGVRQARLLPYNPIWRDKTQRLGGTVRPGAGELPSTWMPWSEVAACNAVFERHGISVGAREPAERTGVEGEAAGGTNRV